MEQIIFDKQHLMQLSEKLKAVWKEMPETEPDFLEQYSSAGQEKKEREISRAVEKGKNGLGEYPQSFFAFRKRKKWKRQMEELSESFLQEEPLLDIGSVMGKGELRDFQASMKEFLRNARKFDKKLGLEDMGQALRNYMVYAIFLALNGRELKYRPAAFGYSMLYPYTDNYIDSPERTGAEKEHYNRLIEDRLKGKSVKALSRHEKKTAELLAQIEKDYGRPHEVYEGLLLMLEAQENSLHQEEEWKRERKESLRQENGQGGEEDLHWEEKRRREDKLQQTRERVLGVSIYKGGISVMMDRYFVDKPWTERDLYFYYGFGFLLQLCDDLQDIVQDKEEGNPTAFSLCRTKGEAVRKVNKLLHFTKALFGFCDTEKPEFKRFLQKNCYLLILASAAGNAEWMEEEWLARMERRLPVRLKYLQEFGIGMLGARRKEQEEGEKNKGEDREKERKKFMRMLDVLIAEERN